MLDGPDPCGGFLLVTALALSAPPRYGLRTILEENKVFFLFLFCFWLRLNMLASFRGGELSILYTIVVLAVDWSPLWQFGPPTSRQPCYCAAVAQEEAYCFPIASVLSTRYELERIGFVFNPRQIEAEKLVAYIAHFKSLHGHCNVPRGFTAASSDSAWEDIMAQFGQKDVVRLGQKVHRLRGQRRNMSREMKQKLQDLGFSWSLRDSIFNDTLLALKIYNDMYGSSKVQRSFVVPHDSDDRWPEALRGFALGEKLHKVKYLGTFIKNRPDRQLRLEELGFDIPPRFAVVARDQGDRQAGHNRVVLNENEEN
eukprot:jgi/Bigna1/77837/fgenesh1_pg.50_\